VIKPNISAIWAEKQAQIKSGELTVEDFIRDNDDYIRGLIDDLDKNGINISSNATPCPVCSKGFLRKRKGQNGFSGGAHVILSVKHHSRIKMENLLQRNRLLRGQAPVLVSPALPVTKRF
jgi:hypothetical protein